MESTAEREQDVVSCSVSCSLLCGGLSSHDGE